MLFVVFEMLFLIFYAKMVKMKHQIEEVLCLVCMEK